MIAQHTSGNRTLYAMRLQCISRRTEMVKKFPISPRELKIHTHCPVTAQANNMKFGPYLVLIKKKTPLEICRTKYYTQKSENSNSNYCNQILDGLGLYKLLQEDERHTCNQIVSILSKVHREPSGF
jgi:hypothetical protein